MLWRDGKPFTKEYVQPRDNTLHDSRLRKSPPKAHHMHAHAFARSVVDIWLILLMLTVSEWRMWMQPAGEVGYKCARSLQETRSDTNHCTYARRGSRCRPVPGFTRELSLWARLCRQPKASAWKAYLVWSVISMLMNRRACYICVCARVCACALCRCQYVFVQPGCCSCCLRWGLFCLEENLSGDTLLPLRAMTLLLRAGFLGPWAQRQLPYRYAFSELRRG